MKRAAATPAARAAPAAAVALAAPRWSRGQLVALVLVTLAAAFLRCWHLSQAPPGLEQDEALGAWIAWCLLKTGRDMSGHLWPIFYTHGIGDSPPPLPFYLTMPFQAVGGLNVWTTRLPGAVFAAACVPVTAFVTAELAGAAAGIVAAVLLAFSPWDVFASRFGVGASECALLAMLPVALLLESGVLPGAGTARAPRPGVAIAAGLVAAVGCYGFFPLRVWYPCAFALLALAALPHLRDLARAAAGRRALVGFALAFLAGFVPLAWMHLADPAMSVRWEMTRLWPAGAPPLQIAGLVLARYAQHFSPDFLFVHADPFELFAPHGQGELDLVTGALAVAGLVFALWHARRAVAARIALALLLAYPAGDLFATHTGPHALRSTPGIPVFPLLAGYGAVAIGRMLAARARVLARIAAVALALVFAGLQARYLAWFFHDWPRTPVVYHGYHADLVEAFAWIEPRLSHWDAVYVTTLGTVEPFSVALVTLHWDPQRWLHEPHNMVRAPQGWDVVTGFGPIRFLYGQIWRPEIEAMQADHVTQHVLFVVRPGELGLKNPVRVVRRPDGTEVLWLCEATL